MLKKCVYYILVVVYMGKMMLYCENNWKNVCEIKFCV